MAPSRACLLANRLLWSYRPRSRSFTDGSPLQHRVRRRASDRDLTLTVPPATSHNALSRSRRCSSRPYSTAPALADPPDHLDENERQIYQQLRDALDPVTLQVQDISGGCGTMFAVAITSEKFKELPVIKQHRLVNQVLGEQIKRWHGLQLKTRAP